MADAEVLAKVEQYYAVIYPETNDYSDGNLRYHRQVFDDRDDQAGACASLLTCRASREIFRDAALRWITPFCMPRAISG